MKKMFSFVVAALATLFMALSTGVVSADEFTVSDLVTETRVVDDTNEIIEKTNGNFVATEVGDYTIADLVTPPTEEPTNPVVPEVDQPEKPSTPVEEPTTPVVEEPSTPVEVPELPIAELVTPPAPVEEPTKPSTPVDETPVDETPVIEKPELPVKPTPTPVVEKPEVPAEPTPTPVVEVPELPVTTEPTPEPAKPSTPVRSEQKMVELPYTGTQESMMALVLAAILLVMAGYIKKEFAE